MRNGKVYIYIYGSISWRVLGVCVCVCEFPFFWLFFFSFDTRGSWPDDRFISTFQIIMVRAHAWLLLGPSDAEEEVKSVLDNSKRRFWADL